MIYRICYRLSILVILNFIFIVTFAQKTEIEILRKSKVQYKGLYNGVFQLIASSVDSNDTSSIKFIATIQATDSKKLSTNVSFLENKIKNIAKRLGANSFKLNSFLLNDSSNITKLALDVYLCRDSILNTSLTTKDTNQIFIFPPLVNTVKKFKIRFNNETIELGYREYFVYHIKPNEQVVIGGGILTDKLTERIFRKENITSRFYEYNNDFNPLSPSVTRFWEFTEDYAKYLLSTYFIHAKTCTNCEL